MATLLKINNVDLTKYIKSEGYGVTEEVLVSDGGRNAKGTMTFDIIARKQKIEVQFEQLHETDVQVILNAIASYVVTADYYNPKTHTIKRINGYVTTPKIEYNIYNKAKLCKEFSLSIIEM